MNKVPQSKAEWLAWLEALNSARIQLGLERIQTVYQALGKPPIARKIVTVGGTNGKGSCSTLIDQIMREAGYSAGLYTSPHLQRINERIKLNGVEVDDLQLVYAFAKVYQAMQNVALTYFEFTTLAAWLLFAEANLDLAILEVGLGGRLDAVNAIPADCSIITTVGLDHMDWLGTTREAIGLEKAGIFRTNKPAVFGQPTIPNSVAQYAKALDSRLYIKNQQFRAIKIAANQQSWDCFVTSRNGEKVTLQNLPIPHLGTENALNALQAIYCLQMPIPLDAIHLGLQRARIRGRFDRVQLSDGQAVILDVAHNPDGIDYLVKRLCSEKIAMPLAGVIAIMQDKDWQTMLNKLIPYVSFWALPTLEVGERVSPVMEMAEYLHAQGVLSVVKYPDVATAFQAAQSHCPPNSPVLVCGSFFTVGQVYQYLEQSL